MRTRRFLLLTLASLAGCSSRGGTSRPQPQTGEVVTTIPFEPPAAGAEPMLTAALPPAAAGVRLVPDSVVLRVGDTLGLRSVRLLAVDSSGAILGRLPLFDVSSGPMGGAPRAIRISGFMEIVAARAGRDSIMLGVPAFQWQNSGPAPRAPLRIIVR